VPKEVLYLSQPPPSRNDLLAKLVTTSADCCVSLITHGATVTAIGQQAQLASCYDGHKLNQKSVGGQLTSQQTCDCSHRRFSNSWLLNDRAGVAARACHRPVLIFGVQTVPMLIQQIMLAELFIPTDPSVLPVKRSGGCDKNRGSFTAAYIQDAT
jgi:hypothetical protein